MRGPAGLTPDLLATPCKITARVSVRHAGRVVAADVPLLGGTFEASVDRPVQDQVRFQLPLEWTPQAPWDPFEAKGQQSHVFVDVQPVGRPTFTIDLGWFTHDEGKATGQEVNLSCVGLLGRLETDPFGWPNSPAKGSSGTAELGRLASPHLGVVGHGLSGSALPSGLAWGTDRLQAIDDLCLPREWMYRVQNDETLHVYAADKLKNPVATYAAKDLALSLETGWDHHRPNVFTGRGGDENDTKKRWAHSTSASGVYSPSTYGTVREIVQVQSAKGAKDVQAAASAALAKSLQQRETVSVLMVPDPRLELHDVIAVTSTADGTLPRPLIGRVRGIAFSLVADKADTARVDVEVLAW